MCFSGQTVVEMRILSNSAGAELINMSQCVVPSMLACTRTTNNLPLISNSQMFLFICFTCNNWTKCETVDFPPHQPSPSLPLPSVIDLSCSILSVCQPAVMNTEWSCWLSLHWYRLPMFNNVALQWETEQSCLRALFSTSFFFFWSWQVNKARQCVCQWSEMLNVSVIGRSNGKSGTETVTDNEHVTFSTST